MMPVEVKDVHFEIVCEIKFAEGKYVAETMNFIAPPMIGDDIMSKRLNKNVKVTGRQFYPVKEKESGKDRMNMVLYCEVAKSKKEESEDKQD